MKVLLLFDVARSVAPDVAYNAEAFLQEDKTAEANILASLERLGHEVVTMAVYDNIPAVVERVKSVAPGVVFNQCESFYGNRAFEPNIPALLDLMRIPYTGSQPDGLLLCKDKALAKQVLSHHHVRVPRFVVSHLKSPLRRLRQFGYPAFVKPIAEESSDGIAKASFVRDEKEAIERLRFLHQKFNSDAAYGRAIHRGQGASMSSVLGAIADAWCFHRARYSSNTYRTTSRSSLPRTPSGTMLTGKSGGLPTAPPPSFPKRYRRICARSPATCANGCEFGASAASVISRLFSEQ